MLIGGVVGHKVQDDLKAATVSLVKQGIQVLKSSEERMNIDVIAYVVAKIGHGRRIDGGEPDGVNTEPAHVIQLAGDAREISHSITIAIEKTARVDLINHTRLPPGVGLCRKSFLSLRW